MNELDSGVAKIRSEDGYTEDGPTALFVNQKSSTKKKTIRDIVGDQVTAVQLNIPDDDTVQPPPHGQKRWRIVLAATLLLSLSKIQTTLQPHTLGFLGAAGGQVAKTQKILFSLFGLVSATLIVVIGYRWVALIGSAVIGVGCLGAAFCNTSYINLLTFLYGALPGIGQSMVALCCTVSIMDHFKTRLLAALVSTELGALLTSFILQLLVVFTFGNMDWKSYLFLQAGATVAMVPISLVLKPLKQRSESNASHSLFSRIFSIDELKIYKSPKLYIFAFVWFLLEGGYTIILAKLGKIKGISLIPFIPFGQFLVLVLELARMVSAFIGYCLPKISFRTTITIVSVNCFIAFFFNLLASQLHNFTYAIIFSGILGISKGLTNPVLEYATPLVLGVDNVIISLGVTMTGKGIGGQSMPFAGDEIEKMTKTVDGCFYLAGALFLLGLVLTALTYHLSYRTDKANIIKPSENQAHISRRVSAIS